MAANNRASDAPARNALGVSARSSSARLGTRRRSELANALGARGHARSSLWVVYSPKARADFVLRGDLQFGHFLFAESDPAVESADYAPRTRIEAMVGQAVAAIVDAEIRLVGGRIVWREITSSDAVASHAAARATLPVLAQMTGSDAHEVATHEVWTEKEIYACPQRILNWLRILPWLAQAREWPLHSHAKQVAALLKRRTCITLGDVLALGEHGEDALYAAALFQGVQHGRYASDLEVRPLDVASRFCLPGHGP